MSTPAVSSHYYPRSAEASALLASKKGLVVIGAGLPRTGTDSLHESLEILLGTPCYHMNQLNRHGLAEAELWCSSCPDFTRLFDSRADGYPYRAGVDFPVSAFLDQLMRRYPDAVIILSKRKSAEDWAKSIESTIGRTAKVVRRLDQMTFGLLPSINVLRRMIPHLWLRTVGFDQSQFTQKKLVDAYQRHNERIEGLIPKDRLIVYTTGDGWEPLCKALKLPVPTVPYPNKNNSTIFMQDAQTRGKRYLRDEFCSWRGLVIVGVYIAAGFALNFSFKALGNKF